MLSSITVSSDNSMYKSLDGDLYSKDGKIFIKYATNKATTDFTIPDGVKIIADHAFLLGNNLENVSLPNSVSVIGHYAFSCCESLKSINIPNSVIEILPAAFSLCYNLNNINIPDSVKHLGEAAFDACLKLESVTIGNGIKTIEPETFRSCSSLASIIIPDGVTSIGEYAFYRCDSLINISLPDSLLTIGMDAFSSTDLNYHNYDGADYLGNENNPYLILISANRVASSIHNDTKIIYPYAFKYCNNLTSITIPDRATLPSLHPQNNYSTL